MKPLLICDCDEVLLHMVRHFGVWLGETHDIEFTPNGGDFSASMKRRDGTPAPSRDEMWGMRHQRLAIHLGGEKLLEHAREALAALADIADIVILTNLGEICRQPRIEQLAKFGIEHRVECNQGGKGGPVARLVAEHGNPVTVFVDDLGVHHESVAKHAPQVHRLHMVSEPALAPSVPMAPAAHARIDDWREAEAWIAARFAEGLPAR